MSKSVIIIGKEFPSCSSYITAASDFERNVTAANNSDTTVNTLENLKYTKWNRSSPISSHAFVLTSALSSGVLDEAVLIFDPNQYLSHFSDFDIETISKSDDEILRGFLYITSEILSHFQNNRRGTFVFVSKKIAEDKQAPILVQAAQNYLQTIAEAIQKKYSSANGSSDIRTVLVDAELHDDSEIASWLFGYLNQLESIKQESLKKKNTPWVKVGDKPQKKLFG